LIGEGKIFAALPRAFYDRDPREVGPDLLGKVLVRKQGRKTLAARIVEVEAYLGAEDPAAHASSGKTSRNAVLFGPPGYAYVYFIYGNHYCLNVSCLPDGIPGGILFRALEPLAGTEEMFKLRRIEKGADLRRLTSGPGRLAQALGIDRQANGLDLCKAPLWVRRSPVGRRLAAAHGIRAGARINVDYAGDWARRNWRFTLSEDRFVESFPEVV